MMRRNTLVGFAVLLAVLVPAFARAEQRSECLLQVLDANVGLLLDGSSLCQTATGNSCTFTLHLCLNQPAEGCTPVSFTKKMFRAKGHCGPVGKLRVSTAGAAAVCGQPADIRVHTQDGGKKAGRCLIRTEVRSSKTKALVDVDTVNLVCNPPSVPCPTTTTTTTTIGASTTSTTL
jgi:hypothetical protein